MAEEHEESPEDGRPARHPTGRGRSTRSESVAFTRAAQAVQLFNAGFTYQQIGDRIFTDGQTASARRSAARKAWARGMEVVRRDMVESAELRIAVEDMRLDMVVRQATEIMLRRHRAFYQGAPIEMVVDGRMEPVYDDMINLAAVDRIIKASESKRRLFGDDAATKHEITGSEGGPVEIIARVAAGVHRLATYKATAAKAGVEIEALRAVGSGE